MTIARRSRFGVALVAVAIGLAIVGVGCADRLILPPTPHVHPDGSPSRAIPYVRGTLEAFTARSPGATYDEPRAFILRFTGGDASAAAQFTAGRWGYHPIEAWVINYPGYGQSEGPRTLRALADASLAAFDELHRFAGDRPIFVEGFSLGTVPALHVAAERPVAGVILQNPPPLTQLTLGRHGWWNLWLIAGPVALQVPKEFDSLANARKSTAPAIFLKAERDSVVPPSYQQDLFDAYAGPKRQILQRGADHVAPLGDDESAQLKADLDWLFGSAQHR